MIYTTDSFPTSSGHEAWHPGNGDVSTVGSWLWGCDCKGRRGGHNPFLLSELESAKQGYLQRSPIILGLCCVTVRRCETLGACGPTAAMIVTYGKNAGSQNRSVLHILRCHGAAVLRRLLPPSAAPPPRRVCCCDITTRRWTSLTSACQFRQQFQCQTARPGAHMTR